jgi:hypothetical protein
MNNAFEPMSQFCVIDIRGVHYLIHNLIKGASWLNIVKRLP